MGGQCVYMYTTFYLSLNTYLKLVNIFCMALKVSVLVFYPLLSLTLMNNQHEIKLKSNSISCMCWRKSVPHSARRGYALCMNLAHSKPIDFFAVAGSIQLLLMSVGTFSLTSVGFWSRFLISLILVCT